MRAFWDMSFIREDSNLIDDQDCEGSLSDGGQSVVPISCRQYNITVGKSSHRAVQYYLAQKERWLKNKDLSLRSDELMAEYLNLGHVKQVPREFQGDTSGEVFYIPCFSVIRQEATSTKIWNVFNASSPTSNGVSLNQIIQPGPKMQNRIRWPYICSRQKRGKAISFG